MKSVSMKSSFCWNTGLCECSTLHIIRRCCVQLLLIVRVQYPPYSPDVAVCNFCWNTDLCECSTLHTHQTLLCATFDLNWKFISREKDLRIWKTSKETQWHIFIPYQIGVSEVLWPIENSVEYVHWRPRGWFWRTFMFYWLFISVLVNAISVSILFEHTSYDNDPQWILYLLLKMYIEMYQLLWNKNSSIHRSFLFQSI